MATDAATPAGEPAPSGPAPSRSVRTSVVSGLVLAAVVLASLFIGAPAFFVLALVLVLVAQWELYTVMAQAGFVPQRLIGLVCGGVLLSGAFIVGAASLPLLLTLPAALLAVWLLTVHDMPRRESFLATYFGILYGPFLASFAALLLREDHGVVMTGSFIAITALQDAGAYLFGRKIGRRKMAPRISPNKTWEGLAAGSGVAVVAALLVISNLGPFTPISAFVLALVVCVVAPLGDLAESLVKRDLGVKDMGTIMPGHGGVFDRIDAILFAAPATYFVASALGLLG